MNNGPMQVQNEAKHKHIAPNLVDYGELQSNRPTGHVPARGIINTCQLQGS